jgi:hypothetical protein
MSKDFTLDSAIHYDHLAKFFNWNILNTFPVAMSCPICHIGRMCIYDDPDGGYWTACSKCEWGDSLFKLYQKLRNVHDTRSAWLQLITDTQLQPPGHLMTQKAFDYQDSSEERRATIEKYWKKAQQRICREIPAETTSIMQSHHIWGTYDVKTFEDRLGKFLGCNDRLAVETIYPIVKPSGIDKGCKNALVVRYETLPGKTSTLLFITNNKQVAKYVDRTDAGLLGLSASLSVQDKAYVVIDPILYLQVQKNALKDEATAIPLLCAATLQDDVFKIATSKSWRNIHHEKVIFWDFESPIELVNMARTLGTRGFIATQPDVPKVSPEVLLSKYLTVPQLQKRWDSSAKPWLEFLKDKLVSATPSDALRMLEVLTTPLTNDEWNELTALCTEEERRKLKFLAQPDAYTRTFTHDGHTYIERPGLGWFKINKVVRPGEPLEALIAEAYPTIRQATLIDGEVHFSGEIAFREHKLPFTVSEAVFRDEPAKFITKICVQHECGVPQFLYAYRKLLVDLALANYKPEVTKSVEKIGWDPVHDEFVFPQFRVQRGNLNGTNSGVAGHLPGSPIIPYDRFPTDNLSNKWFSASVSVEVGWALLASILANVIAESVGKEKKGIILIDPHETGSEVLSKLGEQMALQAFRCTVDNMANLAAIERKHDLPLRLLTDKVGPEWQEWLMYSGPRNAIITTGIETTHNLALLDSWNLIKVPESFLTDLHNLSQIEILIPLFLKRLTKEKPIVSKDMPLNHWVLQDLFSMLGQGGVPTGNGLLSKVQSRMKVSPDQTWERFVHSMYLLMDKGYIQLSETSTRTGSKAPVTKFYKEYHVNWDAAAKALTDNQFFVPDIERLDASFIDNKDKGIRDDPKGWIISEDLWHLTYSTWKSMYA